MAKESNNQKTKKVEELMKGYLEVCHRAIHENKDTLYSKIAGKAAKLGPDNISFTAVVYDDMPDNIVGKYNINFNIEELELEILSGETPENNFTWKVPLRYLKDVVEERPEWYVEQPLRLDFKWLAERVETETRSLLQKPKWLFGFALGLVVTIASFYIIKRKNISFR